MRVAASARVLLFLAVVASAAAAKERTVTFWYVPDAYGGGDIDAVVALMTKHNNTVSNVILECGHSVNSSNPLGMNCAEPYAQLSKKCKIGADTCLKTIAGFNAAGIRTELLVGVTEYAVGSGTEKDWIPASFTPANATIFANTMVEVGKRFNATGINIDAEPDQGPVSPTNPTVQAQAFASFLSTIKPIFAAADMRLTADVAQWCHMTSDYALLAPHADRLLNMEQYNANSMQGWLKGDAFGGFYEAFVNNTPLAKAGPSLGIWDKMCGNVSCWTTQEESGAPRIDRMIADGVEEVALFRLMILPKAGHGILQPAPWWWPLLDKFAAAPLNAMNFTV